MQATSRKIDNLGRIVIPKKCRSELNINSETQLNITKSGHSIVIEKYTEETKYISTVGTLRTPDRNNRIVIPLNILKETAINAGDKLDFITKNDKIIMKKNKTVTINKNGSITIPEEYIKALNIGDNIGFSFTSNSIMLSNIYSEKIDVSDEIIIPEEILGNLNINTETELEIFLEDDYIVIEKVKPKLIKLK